MNAEQWARVKEVFNAALERKPDERRAYVAEAAAGDESVRLEVERLLDAQPNTSDFIEHPAASTLLSGRVISHYEIGRLLGSGGMGRVYAARDTELGREVALKVPSFDGDAAESRLRREAQHASRLSHPHVCHIYEVGRADGQMFVAMELVPGRSLSEVIQEGPLPIANVRRYGMEIADALAHAHEHGVTHRDLKSTNVIITPKRGAKVLDFGLARMLDTHQIDALSQSQRSLTDEGLIAGTLPYMAPELLKGQRGDQRSDIWALGVLLYEMVTARRPFTGATGFEVSAGILHQEPVWPADVPAAMRAVIQRCLEKDPAKRYQSAADVHTALEELKVASLPRMSRRVAVSVMLFVAGLIAAAIVTYIIRSAATVPIIGNIYGYSLLERGQLAEALEQFEGVAEQSPDEANPWDSLGEGYLANGMPDKAVDAYSRALAIAPNFSHSTLGRGLALAALGRYDEALATPSPDFRVQAFLLSRVGRYREAAEVLEKGISEDGDDEIGASALLTAAWMAIEEKQYARALEHVRAAEKRLADRPNHTLLMLADLLGGIAEIRTGNVKNASARAAAQKSRYSSEVAVEAKWMAALQAEIALAQAQYDQAASSFTSAQRKVWQILARDDSSVLAINVPSRDGLARVHVAQGNRAAAIAEYRRVITPGGDGTSAVVEPRHILELARLLDAAGERAAARLEYERFLKLWTNADPALPELTEARQALARG
ncbi:MAG TPA: protein kinase [Vicinamibacterales bacterium]|nr:protein kinase [Vicinamibacterales bacterium]